MNRKWNFLYQGGKASFSKFLSISLARTGSHDCLQLQRKLGLWQRKDELAGEDFHPKQIRVLLAGREGG